jgi:hypothetical protein
MVRLVSLSTAIAALALSSAALSSTVSAQEAKRPVMSPKVLTVIEPDLLPEETATGPIATKEITANIPNLQYTPNFEEKTNTLFEKSKQHVYRRTIWGYEFSFKPLRMIDVDIPQPEGRMKRKLIWYMVYRIRNLGGHLAPAPTDARIETAKADENPKLAERYQKIDVKKVNELNDVFPPPAFFPSFVLRCNQFDWDPSKGDAKEYLDKVIPSAMAAIEKREQIERFTGKPLFDSVTISGQKIPLSTEDEDNSVWGVAMWEDVDPRADFISIAVSGLTNANKYKEITDPKAGEPVGKNREYLKKTLVLLFWRPSDTIAQGEKEIRYGFPTDPDVEARALKIFSVPARVDHYWDYR